MRNRKGLGIVLCLGIFLGTVGFLWIPQREIRAADDDRQGQEGELLWGDALAARNEEGQLVAGGTTTSKYPTGELSVEVSVEMLAEDGTWEELQTWSYARKDSVYFSVSKVLDVSPGYYRVNCTHQVGGNICESKTDAIRIDKKL
jgi:hypothetical protein